MGSRDHNFGEKMLQELVLFISLCVHFVIITVLYTYVCTFWRHVLYFNFFKIIIKIKRENT